MEAKTQGGANNSEGMLANFFNSLLNKKSGATGTPRPGRILTHLHIMCTESGS